MLKPLLIGLTAAVAAGAASAADTSTVTLYGIIDGNVSHYGAGSKSGADNKTTMNDGTVNGLNGSRWGLKTNEDLGSGLSAQAVLEGGLDMSTGAMGQGGLAFGRQAYVALKSNTLGEIRLGRQYEYVDEVTFDGDPFHNALTLNPTTGITNKGNSLPFFVDTLRVNNVVAYLSPTIYGFQLGAHAAPGEGTADRFYGVKLKYGIGAFLGEASYEWNKSRTTDENTNKSLNISASYNFGFAKVYGIVQRNRDLATGAGNGVFTGSTLEVQGDTTFTADRIDGYQAGVEVPWGQWLFGANYSWVKYANDDVNQNLGKAAIGVSYSLSKRTALYAAGSMATGDLKDYIAEKSVIEAGMRHSF
jgi:general bacterial porin, GBP family